MEGIGGRPLLITASDEKALSYHTYVPSPTLRFVLQMFPYTLTSTAITESDILAMATFYIPARPVGVGLCGEGVWGRWGGWGWGMALSVCVGKGLYFTDLFMTTVFTKWPPWVLKHQSPDSPPLVTLPVRYPIPSSLTTHSESTFPNLQHPRTIPTLTCFLQTSNCTTWASF